jgi:hypothetical protein
MPRLTVAGKTAEWSADKRLVNAIETWASTLVIGAAVGALHDMPGDVHLR